jgi:hypothetical protein
VLLDFSKAFDSVDRDLLCHKRFFDFSSSAVGFIRSYLTERSQCVRFVSRNCDLMVVRVGLYVLKRISESLIKGTFLNSNNV